MAEVQQDRSPIGHVDCTDSVVLCSSGVVLVAHAGDQVSGFQLDLGGCLPDSSGPVEPRPCAAATRLPSSLTAGVPAEPGVAHVGSQRHADPGVTDDLYLGLPGAVWLVCIR